MVKITNRHKSMSHGQVVSPTNRSEKLSKEAYLKIDQQHIFESELKQDMKPQIDCGDSFYKLTI